MGVMDVESRLNALENQLVHADAMNADVSASDVKWHIDHCLRVIIGVSKTLINSNPQEYKYKFNRLRTIVFWTRWMPRGRAKAPKSVLPKEEVTVENIRCLFDKARALIKEVKTLDPKSNFKHPYFDVLDLKQSIKFLSLHTLHHLRIIRDICRK